jgi:hypothetical protein
MIGIALAASLLPMTVDPSPALQPAYTDAQAEHDLNKLVETFRTAIIRKDKAAFLDLFADAPIKWQPVDSDARLAQSRSAGRSVAKVVSDPANGPLSFIDNIVGSSDGHEETFENIQIQNDNDIASITFDFSYRVNGKPITVGKESWHVVRSDEGWKIISVIYSRANP